MNSEEFNNMYVLRQICYSMGLGMVQTAYRLFGAHPHVIHTIGPQSYTLVLHTPYVVTCPIFGTVVHRSSSLELAIGARNQVHRHF